MTKKIASANYNYIANLYEQYKKDESVDDSWDEFFAGMEFSQKNSPSSEGSDNIIEEFKVYALIQSYRARGHLMAKTNPVRERVDRTACLNLEHFDLSEKDFSTKYHCGHVLGLNNPTLKEIIERCQNLYCRTIGIEYMHINNTEKRRWIKNKFEGDRLNFSLPLEKRKRILKMLNKATVFEHFLSKKYVGQKRFSLEGGENTITALDAIINISGDLGVEECIIGMAHRGRLNVLANILGKTYEYIFKEFEGDPIEGVGLGDGDVKYHLGFNSATKTTSGKEMILRLMPNPSHLEAVGPVVAGFSRSQSEIEYNNDRKKVLPIIIHGDAAIAGQGIIYESAQMSKLEAHDVGGSFHFVINNQIGFTTDFTDARSSDYCTSVGRVIDAPIIHVNGDDADSVVYACEIALEYRQKFQTDVYVDMVCYRKHGHNEGDEPKYTQPHLYKLISKHPNPREVYWKKLLDGAGIDKELAKKMEQDFQEELTNRFSLVKQKVVKYSYQASEKAWGKLKIPQKEDFENTIDTSISKENINIIGKSLTIIPDDIIPIPKAQRLLEDREKRLKNNKIDWALAEQLAYGSLLIEGINIRFVGQDVIRGTFAHRHAAIFHEDGFKKHIGLNFIQKDQGHLSIYNSLLSEYAVLAFEFGHSLGSPQQLNIWEAQFGDFANGAQTIIDQFISSGSSKWQKTSGLVIYLPHGHEGQGPEHSSGRPERYLQLAAENNMVIANCTTPSNLFHLIRRQYHWNFRLPLILFTPKSLLRHPECTSTLEDLQKDSFQDLIIDNTKAPERIIFCTGKLYYELNKYREENKIKKAMIVRLEQIYPLPEKKINALLKKYPKAKTIWVQEEPFNMGYRGFLMNYEIFRNFKFISRKQSASVATGFMKVHAQEQLKIIKESFE